MEKINQIVNNYLEANNTNYALLIDGPWGCGKTFYFENEIKKIIDTYFKDKYKKIIYISLFGIDSIDEIKKIIFTECYNLKFLEKSGVKVSKEIVKTILVTGTSLLGSEINFGDAKIDLTSLVKDISNYVFVFDDLERVNMPIEKVMGFINNFVEHDGMKTILIANEDEIFKRNKLDPTDKDGFKKSDYGLIKEKLIGRTVKFQLDFEEYRNGIQHIISDVAGEEESYEDFLRRNIEVIEEVVKLDEKKNLRILIRALEDFRYVWRSLQNEDYKILIEQNYDVEILKFYITFSLYIKYKGIQLTEFEKIETREISNASMMLGEFRDSFIGEIFTRYYKSNEVIRYHLELIEFMYKGYFDDEIFAKHLNKKKEAIERRLEDSERVSESFSRKMVLFEEMEIDEFNKMIKDVLEIFDNLEVGKEQLNISELVIIYSWIDFFIEKKIIDQDLAIVQEGIIGYIDRINPSKEELDQAYHYYISRLKDGDIIRDYIMKLAHEENEKIKKDKIPKLDDGMKFQDFIKLLENQKKDSTVVNIIQYIDVERVIVEVLKDNKSCKLFINLLKDIYSFANISQFYSEDINNLMSINEKIEEYLSKNDLVDNPIKMYNLTNLKNNISGYIEKLK